MMQRYRCITSFLLGKTGLYLLLVVLPGSLIAAEWTVTPSLMVWQSYNDNLYLSSLPHPNVTTTSIKPRLGFGWATERANINLLGDWRYNLYAGDPNLKNRTDSRYELKSIYKTERSQFSLDGSYVNDTTLAQESYSEDIGATLAQLDRLSTRISPAWSWMLNERANLRFELSYQDVVYEKRAINPYNDYRYNSAGLTYTFQWTARDQLYAVVNKTRYDSKKKALIPAIEMVSLSRYIGSSSDTVTLQVGLNHQFSSTFKAGLGYGRRVSESQTQYQVCLPPYCADTTESQSILKTKSPVYTISADKNFELTRLGVELNRTVSGSGLGSEMDVDTLTVNINHHVSEKFNFNFKFRANQRVAVNSDFSSYDRKYFRGEVNLGWKLDENWNLNAAYRYTRQRYERRNAIATSNNVSLNIRYSWDRISKSW